MVERAIDAGAGAMAGAEASSRNASGGSARARVTMPGVLRRVRIACTAAVAGLLAMACLAGNAPESRAASLLELNFWLSGPNYSGVVPACDDQEALDLIASRFAETERRFWSSELSITDFEKVQEIAFRPWGPEYQPRRYCRGTVFTNDAHKRAIYYSIIESGGFIGASWGVEWCIVGLDRNYAYAPSCKMARP